MTNVAVRVRAAAPAEKIESATTTTQKIAPASPTPADLPLGPPTPEQAYRATRSRQVS